MPRGLYAVSLGPFCQNLLLNGATVRGNLLSYRNKLHLLSKRSARFRPIPISIHYEHG